MLGRGTPSSATASESFAKDFPSSVYDRRVVSYFERRRHATNHPISSKAAETAAMIRMN
jgi:hypothetical protein